MSSIQIKLFLFAKNLTSIFSPSSAQWWFFEYEGALRCPRLISYAVPSRFKVMIVLQVLSMIFVHFRGGEILFLRFSSLRKNKLWTKWTAIKCVWLPTDSSYRLQQTHAVVWNDCLKIGWWAVFQYIVSTLISGHFCFCKLMVKLQKCMLRMQCCKIPTPILFFKRRLNQHHGLKYSSNILQIERKNYWCYQEMTLSTFPWRKWSMIENLQRH